MKARAALTASLAAAGLLLVTGCSTTISGTARAATHLSVAQTTTSTTESSEAPESTETSDSKTPVPPTAPSTEATDFPSDGGDAVDADSVAWLSAFCYGFSDVMQYAAPDTTGMAGDSALQTVVDAYSGMSHAASEVADRLGSIARPTFPGAEVMAPAIQNWLLAVSLVYASGADLISGATFASEDELASAIDQIEAGMTDANAELGAAMSGVDPAVEAAVVGLPECAVLAG